MSNFYLLGKRTLSRPFLRRHFLFLFGCVLLQSAQSQQWASWGSVIYNTNPGSNKLAVEGSIGARKVVVTQTEPFPDYVFYRGYVLPSLGSVQRYIETNHHLPDMPSADSVARNGLDLGGNQAALLKKIEELTLYVIQQNDKMEAMRRELQEQRRQLEAQHRTIQRMKTRD